LTPGTSSTSPSRIAKLSRIQLYFDICDRFSNGMTTTVSGPPGCAGAFEDGLMNENPCADATGQKIDKAANNANTPAIRFFNAEISKCNTDDFINLLMIAG